MLPRKLNYGATTLAGRRVYRNDKRPSWDHQAEMDLLRDMCRRDFWTFFLYCFGAKDNPKGKTWIDEKIHRPMAEWAQHHVDEWLADRAKRHENPDLDPVQKWLAVLVHREVGKTTLMNRALQLWLHLKDTEFSSYTGSEKAELSIKMLRAMKAVLDGSDEHALWTKLYGNWSTDATTWTGREIVHAARKNTSRQDPSFGIFGVETSITGAHPDAIFYDDPISYERMVTDTNWLKTVNTQVTSLFPAIQSDALVVWVGTRYDDDDHFGIAFKEEGIASISGIETDAYKTDPEGKWHVYFMAGRDEKEICSCGCGLGKPTTTRVWPCSRLRAYQKRDPLKYAAQILNDPSLSELNPLTREQIADCVIAPEQVPWSALRYAINMDLAFWDGESRVNKDETVYIVHGYPRNGSGDVYVVELDSSPWWRGEDLKNRLVALCQSYRRRGRRITRITCEQAMGGTKGVWASDLMNAFNDVNEPFPGGRLLEFKRHSQKKTARMVAAAHFWQDGHVRVVKGAKGVDRLMEQMAKIGQMMVNPKLKDDLVDAHSDAFQPELYHGMARNDPRRGGYMAGARPISTEGINPREWDDSEFKQWQEDNPRMPERNP